MADGEDAAAARRRTAISDYRKKLLNCRELESRVGTGKAPSLLSQSARIRDAFRC
jgi:26S proteasome regulatory subunit T4